MIEQLKPYTKYRSVRLVSLDRVPEHWDVRPLKAIASVQSGVTLGKKWDSTAQLREYPYLSVANVQQGRLALSNVKTVQLPQTEAARSTLLAGDVLVTEGGDPDKLGRGCLWRGELAECLHQNHVFAVRPRQQILSPGYLVNVLASPGANEYFIRTAKQTTNLASTNKTTLGNLQVHLPPPNEQAAIVKFIGHADRKIRRYIRAKQKLIKLLEEQKQAIVQQAVTRGLDPYVRLKASGVGWLGDVPEHWEAHRLKSLVDIKTGGRDTAHRVDGGPYPFFVRSQIIERIDTWSFDGEAVLTAGDGAGVAKVFHYVCGKFDYHQRVYRFSNFRRVSGRFFFEYLRALLKFETLQGTAKSTVDSLRLPMLQNFPVLVPSLDEQNAVVEYLTGAWEGSDAALAISGKEVDLLKEYRTRLISDVVTGKLDVREAAAALPDEEPDIEDADEPDLEDADDDLEDHADLPDEDAAE